MQILCEVSLRKYFLSTKPQSREVSLSRREILSIDDERRGEKNLADIFAANRYKAVKLTPNKHVSGEKALHSTGKTCTFNFSGDFDL